MKQVKLIFISLVVIALITFIFKNLSTNPATETTEKSAVQPAQQLTEPQKNSDKPEIISTNPSPLEEAVIPPNQIIELVFNMPLENIPEFKHRFDPKEFKYKIELSFDRKSLKIIPEKPYEPGIGYTLFIMPDTKFEGLPAGQAGKKTLDKDIIYHFRTVNYQGV